MRAARIAGRSRAPPGLVASGGVSAPAKALLKFSTPRDPAALAAFINLRVPFTYRVPDGPEAPETGWPASLAAFPLGQWITGTRRFYNQGRLDEDRVAQLEKLGMVWSHYDVAWEEGLSAARGWAAENGHLLAPLDAPTRATRWVVVGVRMTWPFVTHASNE